MAVLTKKEEYKKFCSENKSIPLFHSYNWLETVASDNWDVIIEKRDTKIVGVLPYVIFKKKGFIIIDHPSLTVYAGPWLIYPANQKYHSKITFEKDVCNALIEKLPKFDFFHQKLHPSFTNWTPFYWNKYIQSTMYTYILRDLSNKEQLYNNFNSNIRSDIKKALNKNIEVSVSTDFNLFCKLKEKSFNAGLKFHISDEKLEKIYSLCQQNNYGELLIAKSRDIIHCMCLFVWDSNTCYYLYGIANPDYKASGAMSLLLWEAIKKYSTHVKEFNFEGSMIEGVERFFRGFGAEQVPYFQIKKTNSKLLKTLFFIREF